MRAFFTAVIAIIPFLQGMASSDVLHANLRSVFAYGEEVTDSLSLNYKQNNLRFFLWCDEKLPRDSVQYRVMLKDKEDTWTAPIGDDFTFYNDLDPGDYEFCVSCRRKGGEWGPAFVHKFTIENPWWRTPPAIASYIVVITGIVFFIIYLIRARIRINNQLVVERENQRFRNEFVLHASREFRTPLIIIRSIIEKYKGAEVRMTSTDIRRLRGSSRSLMQLVEQLASFGEMGTKTATAAADDVAESDEIPINRDITILVVEPHHQLAEMMKSEMQPFVDVILSTGADVDKIIVKKMPDALVLDTDVTEINAYDALHKIKTNTSTAHMPVIIISTFDNSRSLLRAIRSEADDFLSKPFSCEVLTALVLKKIKNAREGAADTPQSSNNRADTSPVYERRSDKLFLMRLDKIISTNIGDTGLNVNILAEKLGVSRIQLYNKIKELCDKSPLEYLRERRLEQAACLLRDTRLSVKEVRDKVGMPDATNFHRRFKERFGTSPGMIQKNK